MIDMREQAVRTWRLPDSLPRLTGWRWPAFLALWLPALALLLLGTALVGRKVVDHATGAAPQSELLGLSIDNERPWPSLGPPIGAATVATGLRRGDRLVTIDGQLPASDPAALNRQLAGIAGPVTIEVATPTGERRRATLTRTPRHRDQALAAVGLAGVPTTLIIDLLHYSSAVLLPLICAVLLLVRRSGDRLAPWASLMVIFLAIGDGMAGYALAAMTADPTFTYAVLNAIAFSGLVIVLSGFPDARFTPRWALANAVLAPPIVWWSQPLPNAVSNLILVVHLLVAVAAIGVRYRAMPAGEGRQQIRWVLLGFGASVVGLLVLVAVQVLRDATSDYGVFAWTNILGSVAVFAITGLLVLGITVGLLRYRLYDADAAISRSVVYGTLTLSLLAIFAASEKVIEGMGERWFGEELGSLAGAMGAAVAAVMIVPVHHRISHWAERRFRGGLAHLREGLPLLVGDLRETAPPAALADAMLLRVEKGVRARHGAVIARGQLLDVRDIDAAAVKAWLAATPLPAEAAEPLYRDRTDPLFPMRVPLQADGVGLVGWLLLGPRPDGTFFGRDDRAALKAIADPVARALAVTTARAERETALAARDAARDAEIGGLRRAIATLHRQIGLASPPEPASA